MKRYVTFFMTAIIVLSVAACSQGKKEVFVTVNGNEITQKNLDLLSEINPRIKSQLDNPASRQRILDNLVEQDLLYNEALKRGLNRDKLVKAKVDLYRQAVIAQAMIDEEVQNKAEEYYKEHPEEFNKIGMAHIMIAFASDSDIQKQKKDVKAKKGSKDTKTLRTEAEALKLTNQIKERLDKGEKFADLANELSDDPSTKGKNGELGLASKDDKRLSARGYGPLTEKAFTMNVGEVSEPIKTNKGYHIITVTRGIEQESFDAAKQRIMFQIGAEAKNKLVTDLKAKSKIEYTSPEEKKEPTSPAQGSDKSKEKGPAAQTSAEPKPQENKPAENTGK